MMGFNGGNNTARLQTAPWAALPIWQARVIVQPPYKNAVIAMNDKFVTCSVVVIVKVIISPDSNPPD